MFSNFVIKYMPIPIGEHTSADANIMNTPLNQNFQNRIPKKLHVESKCLLILNSILNIAKNIPKIGRVSRIISLINFLSFTILIIY